MQETYNTMPLNTDIYDEISGRLKVQVVTRLLSQTRFSTLAGINVW